MGALSLRLPESLHDAIRRLAEREGVSINTLLVTAVAEKVSALDTATFFERRAKGASRAAFLAALDAAPDVEPDPGDELPDGFVASGERSP